MRPCPHCQRPVRLGDQACPFCATALAGSGPDGSGVRKALAGGAVALALTAACTPPPTAQPVYGAPVSPMPSASASPAPSVSPSASPPMPQPLYGAVMPPSTSPSPNQ